MLSSPQLIREWTDDIDVSIDISNNTYEHLTLLLWWEDYSLPMLPLCAGKITSISDDHSYSQPDPGRHVVCEECERLYCFFTRDMTTHSLILFSCEELGD